MSKSYLSYFSIKRENKSVFYIYDNLYKDSELSQISPIAKVQFKKSWFGVSQFNLYYPNGRHFLSVIQTNFNAWLIKSPEGKYAYVIFSKYSTNYEKRFVVSESYYPINNFNSIMYQTKSSLNNDYILHFPSIVNSVKNFGMQDNSLFFAKVDKNLFGLAYFKNDYRLPKVTLGIALAVYGFTKI